VGFQPKTILVATNNAVDDTATAHYQVCLGAGDSAGNEFCVAGASEDAQATSDAMVTCSDADLLHLVGYNGDTKVEADLTSLDAFGFTLNWDTIMSGKDYFYLCLGGADLTNSFVGSFAKKTSTGSQSVSGVEFEGDLVLFFTQSSETITGKQNGNDATFGTGAATDNSNQWANFFESDNGQGTPNTCSEQSTADCIVILDGGGNVVGRAQFTSFGADGFTLNWSVADANAYRVGFVVLKGGQYKVGSFSQTSTTGSDVSQSVTDVGFQPVATCFSSFNQATAAGKQDHNRMSYGWGVSGSERFGVWCGDRDGGDPGGTSAAHRYGSSSHAIDLAEEADAGSTAKGNADYAATSDGFDLTWNDNDGTSREVLYAAMGSAAAAGTPVLRRRR
jgi:hypothetical protein